jgi:hypothetical protein
MKSLLLALTALLVTRAPALADRPAAEPSIAEVRAAALRHAGLDRTRAPAWGRRARLGALLPTLTLRGGRGTDRDRDLSRRSSGDERLAVGAGEDRFFEARAVWELDRLVFDADEIRAAEVGQRLHRERLALAAQVTTLYFQRRKLLLELRLRPPASAAAGELRRLELAELTAQLDALTGGYFSRAGK